MTRSIDDILNGTPEPEEPKVEPKAEPAPEAKGEPAPEPKAEPEKTEPEKVAPPATRDEPMVPRKALEDERRKRQELEAKFNQPKTPDPVVDPEAFKKHFEENARHQLLNERLNMSEITIRASLGDEAVDKAVEAFQTAVESDPSLYQRVMVSRHPYQTLVDWHKREQVLAEVGTDLDGFRNRILEAEREKIRNELMAQMGSPKPAIPTPSIASIPSAGVRDAWSGPPPIEDIFKTRR